jgi:hypothetical protein
VFLAKPAGSDTTEAYTRLAYELSRLGCDVIPAPGPPLPEGDAEARAALSDALDSAECAVHVLGRSAGIVPAEGTMPLACLQLALAAERASRPGFARHLWLLPRTADANGEYGQHLKDLRRDIDSGGLLLPNDVLMEELPGRQSLQDFIQHLEAVLQPPATSADKVLSPRRNRAASLRVWLVCSPDDTADAWSDLSEHLFDAGLDPVRPLGSKSSQAERDSQAARELRDCDVALVYWGRAGLVTIDALLARLRDAAHHGRQRPFALTALVIAPPDDEDKVGFRTRAVDRCLDCRERGICIESLQPLLATLQDAWR